ncbi:MAG: ABC transporter permease [Phycisphaerales bacterium]
MNFVALKMLLGDRLKYLGLVAGLSFAAMLITQQASILVGLAKQTGSFIRDTSQADLWVMDPEVRFSQDSLPLQDTILQRVRGVTGVEWAVPMYQGFLRLRLDDGTRMLAILVGLDDATLMGGPPTMVKGRLADLRHDAAVIIDEEARSTKMKMRRGGNKGLDIGDRFTINDQDARVVGTFRASKSFFWEPVVYTTYTRALRYAPRERKLLTYVMVKLRPGADAAAIAEQIKSATGLEARTNDEFADLTANYILKETGILVNFGLAVGLGFVIGALVSGQMLYNFTLDNIRHFGALRAMGAGNFTLLRMIFVQAVTVGAIGYGVGIGAGSMLGKLVGDAGLAFAMPWQIPVLAAAAILSMCLLAAGLSAVRVLTQEPAIVFRGA